MNIDIISKHTVCNIPTNPTNIINAYVCMYACTDVAHKNHFTDLDETWRTDSL